ncbi:MAG: Na(+)-translocating NADH-quinone reductase subunit A [Polyangiales bacterium]
MPAIRSAQCRHGRDLSCSLFVPATRNADCAPERGDISGTLLAVTAGVQSSRIKIRRGLDIPMTGVPAMQIDDGNPIGWVGIVAADYPVLQAKLVVDVGSRVGLGQCLFVDRRYPEVQFVSPGAGEVVAVHRGARRVVQTVVVRLDGEEEKTFEAYERKALATLDHETVRQQLLVSGLWPALRTRPFSDIPDPSSRPHSIFVTAIDTNPLAGDPQVIISARAQAFADGVALLSRLTDGAVHVCMAPGTPLPLPDIESVKATEFSGPHPAGLPGTHIHFLDPVSDTRTAWHVNYQDVIGIGALFTSGRISTERVVALAGPPVRRPRLVRTRVGASTEDMLLGELESGECRVISGSVLAGRRAAGHARYLGPHDLQVTILCEDRSRHFLDWLSPGFDKYSAINAFTSSLRSRDHRYSLTTSQHGSPRAMVPIGSFERVMPLDILPTPLLKALIVRDTETARALGCLELAEEDLALCSFVCCSKYEYGSFLRHTLDTIGGES